MFICAFHISYRLKNVNVWYVPKAMENNRESERASELEKERPTENDTQMCIITDPNANSIDVIIKFAY